tara:strand:+ start:7629 stop:8573 length:945 start_codon:yes stop_codon:yes gene_type:complete
MNLMLICIGTFAVVSSATALVSICLSRYAFGYRFAMDERLRDLDLSPDEQTSLSLFNDLAIGSAPERLSWSVLSKRLRQLLERSHWNCSISTFLTICLVSGVVVGIVGFCVRPLAVVPMTLAGFCLPLIVLIGCRNTRERKLTRQLPETFQLISRAVRTGQTIPSTMKIIAEDFPSPISEEFAQCYEQQNRGMSRESALRKLAERTQIMELQIFVVALLVQSKSGGNLVELLDNLADMVEKRLRLKNRVRAMTSEGRMQAVILLVLPFLALAAISILAPDYASVLLEKPMLLVATAVTQCVGIVWIYRIINFEF